MSECTKEVLTIMKVLHELQVPCIPFPISGDNKGAVDAVHADADTANTRHLELHLGFMKDYREMGRVSYRLIPGEDNPADVFTKALPQSTFLQCRDQLGMVKASAFARRG
jgi:hypothetical protein